VKDDHQMEQLNLHIMKALHQTGKTVLLIAFLSCCLTISFAQDSKADKKAKQEAEIRQIIDSQNFVFKPQTALPMGGQSRQLTSDYDLRVTKDKVVSYLPYYGRAYSSTPGTSVGPLDFTSKNFEYNITPTKKNDGWDIVIKPKDGQQVREMLLTAFKNGSANLTVTSNDRQNISFNGYITANKTKKKK
jgi:hypothetical protein